MKISDVESVIPELSLLYAILERAVIDAANTEDYTSSGRTDRRGALAWIYERDRVDICGPWSYRWVCEYLDLCPERTRRNITEILKGNPEHLKTKLSWFAFNRRVFESVPSCGNSNFYYMDVMEEEKILELKKSMKAEL